MKTPLLAQMIALLAAAAMAAEPSFERQLKAIEEGAQETAAEAAAAGAAGQPAAGPTALPAKALPRGVCRIEYSRPVQFDVLMPKDLTLEKLGVEVREDGAALELRVDPALPSAMTADRPARLLRLREKGEKGRRVVDLRIEPGDGSGSGGIYFGKATDDGQSFAHADDGMFWLQFHPGAGMRRSREFSWGFLGMGGRTRLSVDCRFAVD